MLYQTSIPAGSAKEDLVMALVAGIQELTGAKIEMEYMLVVTTDDMDVSAMLDALKDKLLASKNGKIAKGDKRAKGAKVQKARKTEMERASRRIVETGESYSLVELKKMLSAGEIDDGTVVENHRGERFVALGGELIKEPQS